MKTIAKFLFVLLSTLMIQSCSDDHDDSGSFSFTVDFDLPTSIVKSVGDILSYSPVVSPSENITYAWYLDNEMISTDCGLNYTLTKTGIFTLRFEAKSSDTMAYRESILTVNKVANSFTPKEYVTKAIGFFDMDMGDPSTINWGDITHLVLSSAIIQADGSIKYPFEGSVEKVKNIVDEAHSNGVYVMLQIAGEHNAIQGNCKFGSTNFYNVAIDDTRKNAFIEELYNYVHTNGLDGINIYMDKKGSNTTGYPDKDKLVDFYRKMAEAKPEKSIAEHEFYLTMNLHAGSFTTKGHQDDFVALEGYDWYYLWVFGIPTTSAGMHADPEQIKKELTYWRDTKGKSLDKFVITCSSIVALYDFSKVGGKENVTDDNLSKCTTFIKYSALFSMFPELTPKEIAGKNKLDKEGYDAVRYDGLPWIETKVNIKFVHGFDVGGFALWKIDFDSQDPETSVMNYIRKMLNNP